MSVKTSLCSSIMSRFHALLIYLRLWTVIYRFLESYLKFQRSAFCHFMQLYLWLMFSNFKWLQNVHEIKGCLEKKFLVYCNILSSFLSIALIFLEFVYFAKSLDSDAQSFWKRFEISEMYLCHFTPSWLWSHVQFIYSGNSIIRDRWGRLYYLILSGARSKHQVPKCVGRASYIIRYPIYFTKEPLSGLGLVTNTKFQTQNRKKSNS